MKNLKKVLALVVALTMVLSSVCFAFTDVTEDANVYTAVQTLSSLSILNGYEDGTFGPEKDITRAEFAAVVCRALGMEESANGAKGATQFTDVPADHWASGYINLAAGQKIVNGYGDGRFGPEDNVTYDQAVKMLVVALGYEPAAAAAGGFPTGYLVIANQYGLTKGVASNGESANRGVVAQLTYNALDIPLMEQTGFGTNIDYKPQDGLEGRAYKTLLLTKLDVAKLEGVVTGTAIIGGSCEVGEIEYKFTEANEHKEWEKKIGDAASYTTNLYVYEGVNADDYFGYASVIYVKEISNKWYVIAIMPGEDSETISFEKGDIDEIVIESGVAKEIKYYANPTDKKATSEDLATGVAVYYNNATSSIGSIAGWGDATQITLIENTGDSKFDMIIAKEFTYGIIDTVEADRDRYTLVGGNRYTFDFEDEKVYNSIVNKDGEAVTLADFAEGDVVAYITEGAAKKDFKWCEIINLGQNAVKGLVGEINDLEGTIYIDGVEYELALEDGYANTIAVNDEGTYYLTLEGKVFGYETDASVASNYAYILDAGKNSSAFNTGWQFKLLTKDGTISIYDVKDTFVYSDSYAKDAATIGGLEVIGTDGHKNIKSDADLRLITYKLDGNGKIRQINAVKPADFSAISNKEYNANVGAINNNVIADDAVIFNIVGSDMDDAFVASADSLVHETTYDGYLLKNKDGEIGAFVITAGQGAIDLTQDLAIIDSVNKITVDDDDAYKVRYFVGNEEDAKELVITGETTLEYNTVIESGDSLLIGKGTAFMFTADEKGEATNFAVIANVAAADAAKPYVLNATAVAAINADEDLEFVADYIVDFTTSKKGINLAYGASGNMFSVTGDANAYTYNSDLKKPVVEVGDWRGADVDKKDGTTVWYFISILENGVASDIVSYSAQKTLS